MFYISNRQINKLIGFHYNREPTALEYLQPSDLHGSSSLFGKKMDEALFRKIHACLESTGRIDTELLVYVMQKVASGRFSVTEYFLTKCNPSPFSVHKQWLKDPNEFVHFDSNGQSQLHTCLMGCIYDRSSDGDKENEVNLADLDENSSANGALVVERG